MSTVSAHSKILILDFGSQYTQVIARRIREWDHREHRGGRHRRQRGPCAPACARAQLALGASQLKINGRRGGVASSYDPLDVTQYTTDGVKCIEQGQLLDEPAAKLIANKEIHAAVEAPKTRAPM